MGEGEGLPPTLLLALRAAGGGLPCGDTRGPALSYSSDLGGPSPRLHGYTFALGSGPLNPAARRTASGQVQAGHLLPRAGSCRGAQATLSGGWLVPR